MCFMSWCSFAMTIKAGRFSSRLPMGEVSGKSKQRARVSARQRWSWGPSPGAGLQSVHLMVEPCRGTFAGCGGSVMTAPGGSGVRGAYSIFSRWSVVSAFSIRLMSYLGKMEY